MTAAIDWTVLEGEGVFDVAERAAKKVADKYDSIHSYDDLYQEAVLILASKPIEARRCVEEGGLGRLHHWLWCDLVNLVNTDSSHKSKQYSYERSREGVE